MKKIIIVVLTLAATTTAIFVGKRLCRKFDSGVYFYREDCDDCL